MRWEQGKAQAWEQIQEQRWERLLRVLSQPPRNPLLVPTWERWREQLLARIALRKESLEVARARLAEIERALSTTIIDPREPSSYYYTPEATTRRRVAWVEAAPADSADKYDDQAFHRFSFRRRR